jgi:hypothetical protein
MTIIQEAAKRVEEALELYEQSGAITVPVDTAPRPDNPPGYTQADITQAAYDILVGMGFEGPNTTLSRRRSRAGRGPYRLSVPGSPDSTGGSWSYSAP